MVTIMEMIMLLMWSRIRHYIGISEDTTNDNYNNDANIGNTREKSCHSDSKLSKVTRKPLATPASHASLIPAPRYYNVSQNIVAPRTSNWNVSQSTCEKQRQTSTDGLSNTVEQWKVIRLIDTDMEHWNLVIIWFIHCIILCTIILSMLQQVIAPTIAHLTTNDTNYIAAVPEWMDGKSIVSYIWQTVGISKVKIKVTVKVNYVMRKRCWWL